MTALLVLLGGAVGACLRFGIDGLVRRRMADLFPLGTMVVNVLGSFVLGVVVRLALAGAPGWLLPLVGTGLCGALTTFSAFSYDTVTLIERRAWIGALAYAAGSLLLGAGALLLGWSIAG